MENSTSRQHGSTASTDGDSAVLADYLALIWRFNRQVLGCVVVAGLIAFIYSWTRPLTYESTVTFAAVPSKLGEAGGTTAPNTAAFRPLVESMTVAEEVIKEVGLDKSPYELTPSRFLDSLGVTEIRGTSLIAVKVTMPDAAVSARVANAVAGRAVEGARRVSSSEAVYARDLIKGEVDLARKNLDVADERLREFRKSARVEAVRYDIESRFGGPRSPALWPVKPAGNSVMYGDGAGRMGIVDLSVRISAEEARLAAYERDLAARRGQANDATRELEAQTARSRAEVASLKEQRTAMASARPLDPGIEKALDKLYTIEAELARLQVEQAVAERTYAELTQRYQESRLSVIAKSSEFVIIDPARPADRPASRHAARNAVVAMVTSLCFAIAAVLIWDSAKRRRVTS